MKRQEVINFMDKRNKIEKIMWTIALTATMTIALQDVWRWLEIFIYGSVQTRVVDKFIMVPIVVSFWFNAKHIMEVVERE